MDKKELVRQLIEIAEKEGSNIHFDHQFGWDGFVDSNGEFWATDGHPVSEICRRIFNACMDEFV